MARQARSLDVLLAEINALSPDRSKLSDGGIGDAAHSSRESDHNPNPEGVWRARDVTDDDVDDDRDGDEFGDVFDCDWLAEVLVAMYHATDYDGGAHPAMRSGAYTIYKSRIYSYDRRDEGWRPYPGSNPHDKHLHQSVATSAAGYDSTAPWGVMKEIDMDNEQDARLKKVEQAVDRLEDQASTILAVVRKKGSNAWERDVDLKKLIREVLAEVKADK